MKKTALLIILLIALLSQSCSGNAPTSEELEPRLRELIDASYEINDIFFGAGFETYPRTERLTDRPFTYSEQYDVYYLLFEDAGRELVMYYKDGGYKFAEIKAEKQGEPLFSDESTGVYVYTVEYQEPEAEYVYTDEDPEDYLVVRNESKYLSIADLKSAAELVYTSSYLEGVYQALFDGIAYSEGQSAGLRRARFIESGYLLRQKDDVKSEHLTPRIYDFSTMKVVRPSNDVRVNIRIESYTETNPERIIVNLCLIKQADGFWYLDTPTY